MTSTEPRVDCSPEAVCDCACKGSSHRLAIIERLDGLQAYESWRAVQPASTFDV